MGWRIGVIENTVEVSPEVAEEVFKADGGRTFYEVDEVTYDDRLYFDDDHGEHMDYLHDERIQKALLKGRVNGRVAFASVEGDDSGEWWTYTFRDGNCVKNSGKIIDLIPDTEDAA